MKASSSAPSLAARRRTNYRDSAGDLKRQAARFRVFACRRDDNRKLLDATELTLEAVRTITWTVHLVNRKGTARRQCHSGPGFRNHATNNDVADRELIIDPGPRSVSTPGDAVSLIAANFVRRPCRSARSLWSQLAVCVYSAALAAPVRTPSSDGSLSPRATMRTTVTGSTIPRMVLYPRESSCTTEPSSRLRPGSSLDRPTSRPGSRTSSRSTI